LASKHRFLAAQLAAMFGTDLWLRAARHANTQAQRLAAGLDRIDGVSAAVPEANAVFATLPNRAIETLRSHYTFHLWGPAPSVTPEASTARLMCSWATTDAAVHQFLDTLGSVVRDDHPSPRT